MIEIRHGEKEDILKAIPLVDEFSKESFEEYGLVINPEMALKHFEKFVDYSAVAMDGDKMLGLIAGQVKPFECSEQDIFHEQIWFVTKEKRSGVGKDLLNFMEQLCLDDGVSFMSMGHMVNDRSHIMDRFLRSLGYKPLEVHYFKKLKRREQ